MPILPAEIGEIPEEFEDHNGLYLPFPAAIEDETLRYNLQKVKTYSPQEAANFVSNGKIPPEGGVVEYSEPVHENEFDNKGAFDLVAAEYDKKRLMIYPTSKTAVNSETHDVQEQGLVVLTMPNGLLRPIAVAIEHRRAQWAGVRSIHNQIGRTVLMPIDFAARRDFEIKDVNKDGIIEATERRQFF